MSKNLYRVEIYKFPEQTLLMEYRGVVQYAESISPNHVALIMNTGEEILVPIAGHEVVMTKMEEE